MTDRDPPRSPTSPSCRAAPLEDRAAAFLHEGGEAYRAERLLALAARMCRAIEAEAPAGPAVGICSASAAFVTAATMAAWSLERQPIVLDPNLRTEPEAVFARFPRMPVLVDREHPVLASAMVVEEAMTEPPIDVLDPTWPAADQTAALFLTSGSTGEPKLVEKKGFQLFRQMEQELRLLEIPSGLRVCSLVPPFHIFGFVYGLFLPMLGRGTAAFCHGALPVEWIETIEQQRPDLVVGVPYHYRSLAHHPHGSLPDAVYFSSGAPLSPEVDRAFREQSGQAIVQGYGSTETGGIAKRTGLGAWHPFASLQWRIRPDDGRLLVRSPWQQSPDQWYVTDDVAVAEKDGFRLLGRADSIVKVAGKRFSTNEIVAAAESLAEVEHAAAVTYERYGEPAVALFVTPAEGSSPSARTVRGALTARLAAFKMPRSIRVLDALPRLSNGKVDQSLLRTLAASTEGGRASSEDPPAST